MKLIEFVKVIPCFEHLCSMQDSCYKIKLISLIPIQLGLNQICTIYCIAFVPILQFSRAFYCSHLGENTRINIYVLKNKTNWTNQKTMKENQKLWKKSKDICKETYIINLPATALIIHIFIFQISNCQSKESLAPKLALLVHQYFN